MEGFHMGWFLESWKGLTVALEVEEVLIEEKTKHQEITIFKSTKFGNVLVLDGIIQCTERDEFPYHEMIAHLPLFSHPDPKKVLIVGGGDGGVVREVSKHPGVEEIHLCEIDERIIELSKIYLPSMAVGLSSSKLTIHFEDALSFLGRFTDEYDIIIVDCSDYDRGPSMKLFEKPYCERMKKALKPGGILCSLGESAWTDLPIVKSFTKTLQSVFPVVRYAFGIVVPVYIGGQIGLLLASKDKDTVFEEPVHQITAEEIKQMDLKYYNREIHRASFVLPQFVKEALETSS